MSVLAVCAAATAYPSDAFAYLDPGAGSLAYQVLVGLLLGVAVFFRQVRAHLRGRWRHSASADETRPPDTPRSSPIE